MIFFMYIRNCCKINRISKILNLYFCSNLTYKSTAVDIPSNELLSYFASIIRYLLLLAIIQTLFCIEKYSILDLNSSLKSLDKNSVETLIDSVIFNALILNKNTLKCSIIANITFQFIAVFLFANTNQIVQQLLYLGFEYSFGKQCFVQR
jgi:hypothetical protein